MTIYRTKRIDKNVRNINEMAVSEFIIEGKDKALLVDTGLGIFNIKKYVESIVDRKKDIVVLNTHYHPDHSNGNHLFREVYIGAKDVPFKGKLPYDELVKSVSTAIYRSRPIATIPLRPVVSKIFGTKKGRTKYIPLHDGDVIDLGGKKITIRDLPGHTDGSIVLLDKEKKTVYTGDAVNMATWLFTNPGMSLETYADNVEELYADLSGKGYKTLRCSHVPFPSNISFMKDYANFIRNIKVGDETFKFSVPGTDSPLCIKLRPSIKHLLLGVFYFESQI